MTPSADKIASSCNSIKPVMNNKKALVKKEEVPVFLKKVSAVICYPLAQSCVGDNCC